MTAPHAAASLAARRRARRTAWALALAAAGVYCAVIVWYLSGGAA